MSAIKKEERIGGQRLILGDCLEVMKELGRFDAVVTDPPYGIGFGTFNRTNKDSNGNRYKANKYKNGDWDEEFQLDNFHDIIVGISESIIYWGGNYFPVLWEKPVKGIIFWHKHQPVDNFSKGELAWSNIDMPAKFIDFPYYGGIEGKTKAVNKQHPTQKPVAVMEKCLSFLPKASTILDPFMGSGTTLVACQRMGRMGTGIELDPDYFSIACKRVDEATRQPDMFVSAPIQAAKQEELF